EPFLQKIEEIDGIQLLLTTRLAQRVVGGAQKIRVADPSNFHGILEGEKDPGLCPLFGLELEQINALEQDTPGSHGIGGMTREHLSQGALARPVRSHDRVHLPRYDAEIDASKNL